MFSGSVKDDIKTAVVEYTLSNSDAQLYYVTAATNVKQALGAKEILAVTLGGWQANVANKHAISVGYEVSADSTYVLFEPHTFSNSKVTVNYLYR